MNKIRKAVGAITKFDNKYIIVEKIMISDSKNGPEKIDPEWHFPQGGIKEGEELESALFRELEEETGSRNYEIIKKCENSLKFDFNLEVQEKLGYESQETIFFIVDFLGSIEDLGKTDEEINNVKIVSYDEVCKNLTFKSAVELFENEINLIN